jgi:hypothetical protein
MGVDYVVTETPLNGNGNGLTGADMLALVAHITGLLSEMEGRIMDRFDANSDAATERWRIHEKKHTDEMTENTKRVVDRFVKIETALDNHIQVTNAFFEKMHDEEIATQARVKPVKTLGTFVIANWRSIALAVLAIAGIFGWMGLETHIVGQ